MIIIIIHQFKNLMFNNWNEEFFNKVAIYVSPGLTPILPVHLLLAAGQTPHVVIGIPLLKSGGSAVKGLALLAVGHLAEEVVQRAGSLGAPITAIVQLPSGLYSPALVIVIAHARQPDIRAQHLHLAARRHAFGHAVHIVVG